MLWSDENAVQLFCGVKWAIVRRRVGERYSTQCNIPIVKHGGGSVKVRGACLGEGSANSTGVKAPCGRTNT